MRIRSTKPEFWRSERIASVSWENRFLLKGLESYVDDNGVGKDDIALIVGDLFQRDLVLDPSGTLRKVQEGLSALNRAGLLWRYEHDGTPLIYIAFWEKAQYVQKPQSGRNPRPDGTFDYKDSTIGASPPEASGSLRNVPALNREQGTEEQVSGEQVSGSTSTAVAVRGPDLDALFESAYLDWPVKKSKEPARKKFKQLCKQVAPETLAGDIRRFGQAYAATTATQFVPHLSTWLNQERWTDELPQRQEVEAQPRPAQVGASLIAHYSEEPAQGELTWQ